MIEESKPCSDVMKKYFNKVLVITKEDNENFKNSTKCTNSTKSVTMVMLIMMLK